MADLQLAELRREFFEKADDLKRLAKDVLSLRDRAFPVGSEIRLQRCPRRLSTLETCWSMKVEFPATILGGSKDRWRENIDLLTDVLRDSPDG